ncbi:MAG: M20/M25/M40 family metallo-hydrolase, partial [Mesorhizobium sp.]
MPSTAPRSGTLSVLGALVDFDTTSRNSNLPLIAWIEARLTALGAHCERVLDESGTKATLWATFGPENVPGIVLSGHTDTVPVDGQDWNYPPHSMTEEGERLYGRGTSDMKGFLACCVAMAPMIAQAPLKVPIHFAFTYDEEVGCLAVRPLL